MATGLTKKQKEALTDKITGLIRSGPALRMTTDSSVNEMNINQISGELNRIHYRAIGKDLPAVFSFEPKQLGSGDPSPDNIRPIVGYEIDGIGTVYGGDLNIETGVLTVTYGGVDLGTFTWSLYSGYPGLFYVNTTDVPFKAPASNRDTPNAVCAKYQPMISRDIGTPGYTRGYFALALSRIYIADDSFRETSVFKESLSGIYLVYELNTPETYTLTPEQMIQLLDQI